MYNEKILLEMLDIAVSFMNEQEACSYCVHSGYRSDCSYTDECCKEGIFEGLYRKAKRTIENESKRNDAA